MEVKMSKINDEWNDLRFKDKPRGFDERLLLKIWRFCKIHWEFWVGFIVGIMVITLIIK
jgi:hypothetical protein